MLNRKEWKDYALQICVPLMERTARRALRGETAFKADQVGFVPAFLENFCRPFWGISPLIAQGEDITLTVEGEKVTIFEYMRGILLKGLSHGQKESWDRYKECFGAYVYENQNITELAGLMIGLFFAKEQLWEPFTREEKDYIAKELYEMAVVAFDHSWPNNHYWFPLFTITVLKRLGYSFERMDDILNEGLEILDGLYIGDGWYKDGEFGRFDYYEAWSLHLYPLLWTLIADESFAGYENRRSTYVERTNRFLDFYAHWFDEKGTCVPFGRSLSYRFAASAIFPVAVLAGCDVDPALAGRLTAMNIEYFQKNYKAEETEILAEGYLYPSSSVVEGYTSDGGAYWCCKTFLAFLIPEKHPFWQGEEAKLSAEKGDYLAVPAHKDIHMLFEGHKGIVTLYNNTAQYYHNNVMTHKFGDMRGWYSKFAYNSAGGFACSAMDKVSFDSMISLMTPDCSMISHRLGYTDLGYENGVLHSIHIQFVNDRDSVIETWMIPLDGKHVRIHKVKLSQPYFVQEGGFSLSRWDDYCPKEIGEDRVKIYNHEYASIVKAAASVPLRFGYEEPQAGYHLYGPLSEYPVYKTELLEPGEYFFAAVFALVKVGDAEMELPDPKEYLAGFMKL